ncbi:YafY family protein [Kutzneria buriramensis]|nr:YafY family protein [Kutzneria buriramensis]
MRASRLLSTLLLLQTRGRMTAQELADELEVSVRTVYRDIESLSVAGVPVYADRGPTGGYQLLDGYRTRLTGLTTDEADSLFLAGMPGPAAELGLGTVVATAELKMLAALPPDLRARASRIRERFHLDAPGWLREADEVPFLAEIADSVWNERMVEIRYRRWKTPREVTRRLAPLGVVLKAGTWYLVGLAGDEPRTFRVSNVLGVQALDERFDRPADFDLAAYWQEWADQFEVRIRGERTRVRLSPEGVRALPYFMGRSVADQVMPTLSEPDADGWMEAVVPVETLRHAHAEFLRLGAEVEVLEPAELREMVASTVGRLTGFYGSRRTRPE